MSTPMPKFTLPGDILFIALKMYMESVRKEMDLAIDNGDYDAAEKMLGNLRVAGQTYWSIEPSSDKLPNIFYQCNEVRKEIPDPRHAPPAPSQGLPRGAIPSREAMLTSLEEVLPAPVSKTGPAPILPQERPRPIKASAHFASHGDEQAKDINLFGDK